MEPNFETPENQSEQTEESNSKQELPIAVPTDAAQPTANDLPPLRSQSLKLTTEMLEASAAQLEAQEDEDENPSILKPNPFAGNPFATPMSEELASPSVDQAEQRLQFIQDMVRGNSNSSLDSDYFAAASKFFSEQHHEGTTDIDEDVSEIDFIPLVNHIASTLTELASADWGGRITPETPLKGLEKFVHAMDVSHFELDEDVVYDDIDFEEIPLVSNGTLSEPLSFEAADLGQDLDEIFFWDDLEGGNPGALLDQLDALLPDESGLLAADTDYSYIDFLPAMDTPATSQPDEQELEQQSDTSVAMLMTGGTMTAEPEMAELVMAAEGDIAPNLEPVLAEHLPDQPREAPEPQMANIFELAEEAPEQPFTEIPEDEPQTGLIAEFISAEMSDLSDIYDSELTQFWDDDSDEIVLQIGEQIINLGEPDLGQSSAPTPQGDALIAPSVTDDSFDEAQIIATEMGM